MLDINAFHMEQQVLLRIRHSTPSGHEEDITLPCNWVLYYTLVLPPPYLDHDEYHDRNQQDDNKDSCIESSTENIAY